MPTRRRLVIGDLISQDAVQALIMKEALLKAGCLPSQGTSISSDRAYRFTSVSWSDSAAEPTPKVTYDDESLRQLYAEFETEDRALANAGLSDYRQMLAEIEGE
jgi:hypothetical protein